mmetsp:Transcript_4368/g.12023  ORF Transcript_4368/g.12023 Transcript_4368/m.12023 type:complete len:215 (-) Transcript_4368:32-676(-)
MMMMSIMLLFPLSPFPTPRFVSHPSSIGFGIFVERFDEGHGDRFGVQKIAVPAAGAIQLVVIAAPGFAKIRHGTVLAQHQSSIVIPAVHDLQTIRRVFFVAKFGVHVTDQMIGDIVGNVQAFEAAEFGQFQIKVFVETEKFFEDGLVVRGVDRGLEQVRKQEGLGKGGLVVQSGATIGVAAGANFVIKGTIHLVFFGTVNARQVFCHGGVVMYV